MESEKHWFFKIIKHKRKVGLGITIGALLGMGIYYYYQRRFKTNRNENETPNPDEIRENVIPDEGQPRHPNTMVTRDLMAGVHSYEKEVQKYYKYLKPKLLRFLRRNRLLSTKLLCKIIACRDFKAVPEVEKLVFKSRVERRKLLKSILKDEWLNTSDDQPLSPVELTNDQKLLVKEYLRGVAQLPREIQLLSEAALKEVLAELKITHSLFNLSGEAAPMNCKVWKGIRTMAVKYMIFPDSEAETSYSTVNTAFSWICRHGINLHKEIVEKELISFVQETIDSNSNPNQVQIAKAMIGNTKKYFVDDLMFFKYQFEQEHLYRMKSLWKHNEILQNSSMIFTWTSRSEGILPAATQN